MRLGRGKNGRTKENISDSQICEETKNKDIYTGNTGTVQTVNPKNQFPFPGCLLYIRLTEEQKVLPTYSNVKIKPDGVAYTYDFSTVSGQRQKISTECEWPRSNSQSQPGIQSVTLSQNSNNSTKIKTNEMGENDKNHKNGGI